MSVYLHIGYPKCASSWFKKKFLPKIHNIELYDRMQIKRFFLNPGAFDFEENQAKKMFPNEKNRDIWISEEFLTSMVWSGGANGYFTKEIANRLKKVFPDANIIFIIRNQIDILASTYLQYLKGGGTYSINKFLFPEKYLHKGTKNLIFTPDFYLYNKAINYYVEIFGKERVQVLLFEDFKKNPQKFISEFAMKYNLSFDESEIDFSIVNMGYRKMLMHTRRLLNHFSRYRTLNKHYLFHIPKLDNFSRYWHSKANQLKIFGAKPSSYEILGEKNVHYFVEYYAESNKDLLNCFQLSKMKDYHYPL